MSTPATDRRDQRRAQRQHERGSALQRILQRIFGAPPEPDEPELTARDVFRARQRLAEMQARGRLVVRKYPRPRAFQNIQAEATRAARDEHGVVHHRRHVRKLKPWLVEAAQAKARAAAEQAHPTASPLVGE